MFGYCTSHDDRKLKKLVDWANNVERTCGFDDDECYELVLRDVQKISWSLTCRNRSLVDLVGAASPHLLRPKSRKSQWRKEAHELKFMDNRVDAVHALVNHYSWDFYRSLANITNGTYLKLPVFYFYFGHFMWNLL